MSRWQPPLNGLSMRLAQVRNLKPQVEYMRLERVDIDAGIGYPQVIAPVVRTALEGGDIVRTIDATVKRLGFNTFMYGCSAVARPNSESRIWTLTTLPLQWVRHYEACDYIEVAPRTQGVFQSPLPVIWDQSLRHRSRRLDRFLDEAGRTAHVAASPFGSPITTSSVA
jgi:hypothetical protein